MYTRTARGRLRPAPGFPAAGGTVPAPPVPAGIPAPRVATALV